MRAGYAPVAGWRPNLSPVGFVVVLHATLRGGGRQRATVPGPRATHRDRTRHESYLIVMPSSRTPSGGSIRLAARRPLAALTIAMAAACRSGGVATGGASRAPAPARAAIETAL